MTTVVSVKTPLKIVRRCQHVPREVGKHFVLEKCFGKGFTRNLDDSG